MALHQVRGQLRDKGIEYPEGFGQWAHHVIGRPRATFSSNTAVRTIAKLVRRHRTVLLASEFFSEYSDASLRHLRGSIPSNVEITAIFSMRRLEKIIASQYQQIARVGIEQSFQDYSEGLLQPGNQSQNTRVFWNRHAYDSILARWAEAIGASNVHLVLADDSNHRVLNDWFEDFLGLEKGSLRQSTNTRMNRSLDIEELAFIQSLQRKLSPKRLKAEWVPIFRNRMIAQIVSSPSTNPESKKLQLPSELHQLFVEKAEDQFLNIQELGINISGSWPKPSPVGEAAPEPTKIHIETVAAAIAAVSPENYLPRSTTTELVRELLSRVKRSLLSIFPRKKL